MPSTSNSVINPKPSTSTSPPHVIQVFSEGGSSRNQSCVKRVTNKSSLDSKNDLTNSESLNDNDVVIDSNVGPDGKINHLTFTLNEGSDSNVNAKK